MHYQKLGITGLLVSHLGFGTMRLPIRKNQSDFNEAISLIQYGIEKGINFFDVGSFYCHGHCEEVFGQATKDISRDKLIISGKNSSHQSHSKDWLGQLKKSLELFQREYFDLYFLHYLDHEHWEKHFIYDKVIDQVNEALDLRLIRHLAFSSHDTPENVKKIIDTGYFEVLLLQYNILNRKNEQVLKYAYDKGLGVVIMNALAGKALLDNKFSFIKTDPSIKCSTMELALNFVLSQPFIHTVLLGMDTKEIIDRAVKVVDGERFSDEKLSKFLNLVDEEKVRLAIPCTACNYCLPCIQGIDIPKVIDVVNQYCILEMQNTFSRDYAILSIPAECCIGCDICKEKCPNNINIPEIMVNAASIFGSVHN